MKKEIKVLLGADNDGDLVWGEFGYDDLVIYDKNGKHDTGKITFSASFDVNMPFPVDYGKKERLLEDNAKEIVECSDKETLYDLCCYHNCSPNDLYKEIADEYDDIRDAYDCSTFNECYEIDGTEWYFLCGPGGQHDTRTKGMMEYTSKEVYDEIHALWDKFHLKSIDAKTLEKVNALMDKCEELCLGEDDWMETWITDYICRNKELLENNEP